MAKRFAALILTLALLAGFGTALAGGISDRANPERVYTEAKADFDTAMVFLRSGDPGEAAAARDYFRLAMDGFGKIVSYSDSLYRQYYCAGMIAILEADDLQEQGDRAGAAEKIREAEDNFRLLAAVPFEDGAKVVSYCSARLLLLSGREKEAGEIFQELSGTLDSDKYYWQLVSSKFTASAGTTAAELTWADTAADTDGYEITYMPRGVGSYARTEYTDKPGITLSGLLPRTTYVALLTPMKGTAPSGPSAETEFTTKAPQKISGIRMEEAELYAYSKTARERYLSKLTDKSVSVFLNAVTDTKKREMLIGNGSLWPVESIALPIGEMAFSESGFVFRCMWKQKERPGETVRVVFRTDYGENGSLAYYLDVPVSYTAGFVSMGFYLDDLLDEIYINQGWPSDTDLVVEYYSGETQIYLTGIHMGTD